MASYRVYKLDTNGKILGPPHIVDCDDDMSAITEAQAYVDGYDLEVWDLHRRVAVIPSVRSRR